MTKMASLDWKIADLNREQIANEIATLRAQSPTFRRLEQMAWDRGYRSVEVTMVPRVFQYTIAESHQSDKDPSVRQIRIGSDATGTFGINGRQITVAEIIAHELAHGVIPPDVAEPGKIDFNPKSREELWARRQAGAVAVDLGFGGPNNADFPITRVPVDREQACTFGNIQGNTPRDGVLFLDGSRGSNGLGSTAPGRSGSVDPGLDLGPDPGRAAAFDFGDARLGSAMPLWPAYQGPLSDPLVGWLQSTLAGNGAGLLTGTLPWYIPQPVQIEQLGAFSPPLPQTQQTPQPFPAAPPSPFSVPVPEALQPLVRHFFPQGIPTNSTQAWPSATADDAGTQSNSAGSSAGAGPASAEPTPQPFAALPSYDVPIPEALRPLLRLFLP